SVAAPAATTFVFKIDMHCVGCAKKIKRIVKQCEAGVKDVTADCGGNKLTVVGKIDPVKVREKLVEKTKRKVELLSPLPPPKTNSGEEKTAAEKSDKKDGGDKAAAAPPPKEATVVLKIRLHCDGCINKIKKIILKIKGVETVNIDGPKDLVTIKGTMDDKELVPFLKQKLKRNVEAVFPAKKEDGAAASKAKEAPTVAAAAAAAPETKKESGDGPGKKNDAGVKKDASASAGDKKDSGAVGGDSSAGKKDGGEKKEDKIKDDQAVGKNGGGGGDDGGEGVRSVGTVNKMEYYGQAYPTVPMYWHGGHVYGQDYQTVSQSIHGPYPYSYASEGYAPYSQAHMHAPGMFSDENPNGCTIM
ncbi:PREDICTED: heavy metal-associated isoprenylated plant protein 3, partial [Tarenaya hassleriana]|uniref:heavy metal-associated isoprenylated plant protein 3 n=1 Tax=Tarenaya hassleriana TaxID=28532 RepID=UPI00053C19AB